MSFKSSNFVSVFALSAVLASAPATTGWAMEADELELPLESKIGALQLVSETLIVIDNEDRRDLTSFYNLRLTSTSWKEAADDVILRRALLSIAFNPNKYDYPDLENITPLVTKIFLSNWDETNSDQIDMALKKHDFSNLLEFVCSGSGSPGFTTRNITKKGIKSVAQSLEFFPLLQNLYISSDSVGEQEGALIGKMLPCLPQLKRITIMTNMGPIGTKELAKGLDHKHLNFLNVRGNGVGDAGCEALANCLEKLPSLKTLRMNLVCLSNPGGVDRYITNKGREYFTEKVKIHNQKHNSVLDYTL